MCAYISIYTIFTMCFATITFEMVSKLTDQISHKFDSDLDLEISRSNDTLPMSLASLVPFARDKSRAKYLIGLFHIWPWALTLPVTLAINFQGQITKFPYPRHIRPCREESKRGEFLVGLWFLRNPCSRITFTFVRRFHLSFCPQRIISI